MTLKLSCCASDLIYSNLDGNTNKFFKSLTIIGRNLNKYSITLFDNLRDKLIILHTSKYLQSYIYICTRLYTTLINGIVYNSVLMNTTPTKQDWLESSWEQVRQDAETRMEVSY